MKRIYFVRHAKSSWEDISLRDFDRPLNKRGLRDAPFMANRMKALGVKADLIVSSPANRAYTTATYFAKALDINVEQIVQQPGIYEAFPEDIMLIVNGLPQEVDTVFVFGHNPAFTSIANRFSSSFIANIPTCGIFTVEAAVDDWRAFDFQTGTMVEFLYPKQYFN
jgi:phosphohistidine phosphatase